MNAHAQGDKVTRARQERQEGLQDREKARSRAGHTREGGTRQRREKIVSEAGQEAVDAGLEESLDAGAFREEGLREERLDEGRAEACEEAACQQAVAGAARASAPSTRRRKGVAVRR